MSTFSGFIPELPGVAIDCFEEEHRSKAFIFFLSHCQADHMRGLELSESLPGALYLSPISGVFIRHRFPQHAEVVRSLNVGEQLALKILPPTGEAYELYVRSISAEHCPGSVMFYFETSFTRVLYTGDFRLTSQEQFAARTSEIRPQIVYLDSTFLDKEYSHFPTRDESADRITSLCTEWLEADQRNLISLWLPANYGSEELFLRLFERLKEKIHVSDKQRGPYMHIASLDAILTGDSSARIHVCNGTARAIRELPCRTLEKDNEYFLRTIRPSALRWRGLLPTEHYWKESSGLFYVCYSAHASCDELTSFLRHLQPDAQEIRFNVIANDADRLKKEQVVASMSAGALNCMTTRTEEKKIILRDDQCLHLDKIEYKQNHPTEINVSQQPGSDYEDFEQNLSYSRLPKRTRRN